MGAMGGANDASVASSKWKVDDELVDCVAVCQEDGPVSRIAAVDDMFVWTATTNKPTVNRWVGIL
jgi:hypothetical protein